MAPLLSGLLLCLMASRILKNAERPKFVPQTNKQNTWMYQTIAMAR